MWFVPKHCLFFYCVQYKSVSLVVSVGPYLWISSSSVQSAAAHRFFSTNCFKFIMTEWSLTKKTTAYVSVNSIWPQNIKHSCSLLFIRGRNWKPWLAVTLYMLTIGMEKASQPAPQVTQYFCCLKLFIVWAITYLFCLTQDKIFNLALHDKTRSLFVCGSSLLMSYFMLNKWDSCWNT